MAFVQGLSYEYPNLPRYISDCLLSHGGSSIDDVLSVIDPKFRTDSAGDLAGIVCYELSGCSGI